MGVVLFHTEGVVTHIVSMRIRFLGFLGGT